VESDDSTMDVRTAGGVMSSSGAITDVRLAVIAPTANRLPTLRLLVESLAQQTDSDFRTVISDEGSTDGTREYLDHLTRMPAWRERLTVVRSALSPTGRRSRTRNVALANVPVDVTHVLIVDSDLVLHPEAIRLWRGLFGAWPDAVLIGEVLWLPRLELPCIDAAIRERHVERLCEMVPDVRPVRVEGTHVGQDLRVELFRGDIPEGRVGLRPEWSIVLNSGFPMSLLDRLDGFDESFVGYGYEDLDLGARAAALGAGAVIDRSVRALHVWHPRNWSHEANELQVNLDRMIRKHGMQPYLEQQVDWDHPVHKERRA